MAKPKGFKAVQSSISKKEGIPMMNAGAILANASRKASPPAKKKNPNLNKVLGATKPAPMPQPTTNPKPKKGGKKLY